MKRYVSACLALLLPFFAACNFSPRSDQSFDQIRAMVQGKTASEIESILGAPDSRELLLGDERWIWRDYTYLGGKDYSSEIRGQVVHLQINFRKPGIAGSRPSSSEWRVLDPRDVSFLLPDNE